MYWMFVTFVFIGWSTLFVMHLLIYKSVSRVYSVSVPYWPLMLGVLASLYFLGSVAVRTTTSTLSNGLYLFSAVWLGLLFITFSCVLLYELMHRITGFESVPLFSTILAVAVSLSCYALYNGKELVVREYSVPVAGLVTPLRIVHLSDIHVGTVHRTDFLRRIVDATNKLTPDVVLVTGDLFDGSAPIDSTILSPLKELTAPSYFSNGNHEFYEGLENVRHALSGSSLILLENEAVEFLGVQIIGANDAKSIPRTESLGEILDSLSTATPTPRVLMYHTPVEWEEARTHGVDLMLSGHTHNGQIFPFTLLVRIAFQYINGLYEVEGKYLHVSPGTGTWGPPMRLGSRNQITVLTLEPSQE